MPSAVSDKRPREKIQQKCTTRLLTRLELNDLYIYERTGNVEIVDVDGRTKVVPAGYVMG